ncbi:1,2-diacylglycerol 3-glucosyltransferase, partial [Leuconostoc pseudomesenteroides]
DELLAAVQKYLERPNTLADEQVRQAKMKDVDATKFAERVLAFYQDILADYHADDVDDEYPNDEEVGYMKRILRNPFRRS